ncbi:MAG: peptidoglycan DD-metalloendopeptidase family protein [Actinomycetales bacterium]|nr:peptidoglycan DD-metalloendopeptidase family protein [Actinomycetales bacterium]
MNLRRISTLLGLVLVIPISSASAAPIYVFPVAGCEVNYAKAHHDYAATDIVAKKGCKFVAPINGVIDEVNRIDSWSGKTNLGIDRGGLYVSIIGDDGVRYYGSHLQTIPASIEPGVSVLAGRLLGSIGSTGSARGTAPHLHFGISWPTPPNTWWVRRGEILPWKYLDAWKSGKDLSPVKEVNARKLKVGEIPPVPKK